MTNLVTKNNTKAQILAAYEDMLKKEKEKSTDNIKEVQERKIAEKTLTSVKSNTNESIIRNIEKIKKEFISSLDEIKNESSKEYAKFIEIQSAIEIEKKDLEQLYGLKANADSFAALLLAQKEIKEKFEEEKAFEKEKFDNEVSNIKQIWAKEKEGNATIEKEIKEELSKSRKREEEEYVYNLKQKRKKETDTYEFNKQTQEAEIKIKRIDFEKEFATRERIIVENEKEYDELKKASEQLPETIQKAVNSALKELETQLKTEFNYEKNLLAKETEGIVNLKELTITSLESKIKEIENQLKTISSKADISEKTVKDIALKAIESTGKIQLVETDKQLRE